MAYFDDIYKTIKEKLNYKITITNGGFVVEDFKSIIFQSKEHIEILSSKNKLQFDGNDFVIKELQNGLLIVTGALKTFEVVKLWFCQKSKLQSSAVIALV